MIQAKVTDVLPTARKLMYEVAAVQPDEKVLIVADYDSDEIVLDALASASKEAGAEPLIAIVPPRAIAGDSFPRVLEGAIRCADVIFGAASTDIIHSLIWGPGSKIRDLADRTWRLVEMSQSTAQVLVRPGARGDYEEMRAITDAIFDVVKKGKRIRITTPLGTDIEGLIGTGAGGSLGVGMNRGLATEVGSWCCFPDGEVYVMANGCIGTNPGDAEGTVVFDTSMHMLGLLREPVRCRVEAGKVTAITGGWQAEKLRRILAMVPDSNNIVELGSIGTNPFSLPQGECMFEDRKSLGTVHVAVGNRYIDMYDDEGDYRPHFVHLDGVLSNATIYLDGAKIIEDGRVLILEEESRHLAGARA